MNDVRYMLGSMRSVTLAPHLLVVAVFAVFPGTVTGTLAP